ncbi:2OG-Fe(II) oxygenase [Tahibacter amnicola]|uniref:2OG-Fe(II) oxygenase n=1 Tax=Tahibacter amnicola TaxID=2976241 RepID=A0ABY6BC51_9GAMM|nr:2OG-Fe(II) oxygenase [Tahibacter amnicola]UXI67624.1 2OG-Fe(II) oxygenase [Tahibacter amnicola]
MTSESRYPVDDLRRYIQVFDNALPDDFCDQMVQSFNHMARFHVRNGRGYRQGLEESGWTELDITPLTDAGFQGFFFKQIDDYLARYNQALGLTIPVPPTSRFAELRIKRYASDGTDGFQPHFDSINQVANRYLVFLWYLNDVEEGGETQFVDLDVKVPARKGRLLVFPPYWMYQHAGLPPRSSDKYIISTYLLFPDQSVNR